jgi:hypothetical protein
VIRINYRIWCDAGMFYWEALTEGRSRIGFGANSDIIKARAEALVFSISPARLADIDAAERRRSAKNLDQARALLSDVERRAATAEADHMQFRETGCVNTLLIARSRDAMQASRRLLIRIEAQARP